MFSNPFEIHKCYRAIPKAIRLHETASVIIKEAVAEMKKALAETEFSKDIYKKGAKSFVARFTRASSYAGADSDIGWGFLLTMLETILDLCVPGWFLRSSRPLGFRKKTSIFAVKT